jgi:hypothetical protein
MKRNKKNFIITGFLEPRKSILSEIRPRTNRLKDRDVIFDKPVGILRDDDDGDDDSNSIQFFVIYWYVLSQQL